MTAIRATYSDLKLVKTRGLQKRFESKFVRGRPDECWNWTAATSGGAFKSGYGVIKVSGKTIRAHRVSWEIHRGPIPSGDGYHGICVLHRCDNRLCVNPAHLFLGTHTDNMADMAKKGRGTGVSLPGESHPNAKLTGAQVAEIRRLAKEMPQARIAERFNISKQHTSDIVNGRRW